MIAVKAILLELLSLLGKGRNTQFDFESICVLIQPLE